MDLALPVHAVLMMRRTAVTLSSLPIWMARMLYCGRSFKSTSAQHSSCRSQPLALTPRSYSEFTPSMAEDSITSSGRPFIKTILSMDLSRGGGPAGQVADSTLAFLPVTINGDGKNQIIELSANPRPPPPPPPTPVTVPDMFQVYLPSAKARIETLGLVPAFAPPNPSNLFWFATQSPVAESVDLWAHKSR